MNVFPEPISPTNAILLILKFLLFPHQSLAIPYSTKQKIGELDSELAKAFHKKLHKSEGCVNILFTGSYDGLTKKLFEIETKIEAYCYKELLIQ